MMDMFKKLGLGEWAVGGTDAIRKLKDTQYVREQQIREEMGFQELIPSPEGGPNEEAGYSHEDVAEDDY
jgi:hypothetical protein